MADGRLQDTDKERADAVRETNGEIDDRSSPSLMEGVPMAREPDPINFTYFASIFGALPQGEGPLRERRERPDVDEENTD